MEIAVAKEAEVAQEDNTGDDDSGNPKALELEAEAIVEHIEDSGVRRLSSVQRRTLNRLAQAVEREFASLGIESQRDNIDVAALVADRGHLLRLKDEVPNAVNVRMAFQAHPVVVLEVNRVHIRGTVPVDERGEVGILNGIDRGVIERLQRLIAVVHLMVDDVPPEDGSLIGDGVKRPVGGLHRAFGTGRALESEREVARGRGVRNREGLGILVESAIDRGVPMDSGIAAVGVLVGEVVIVHLHPDNLPEVKTGGNRGSGIAEEEPVHFLGFGRDVLPEVLVFRGDRIEHGRHIIEDNVVVLEVGIDLVFAVRLVLPRIVVVLAVTGRKTRPVGFKNQVFRLDPVFRAFGVRVEGFANGFVEALGRAVVVHHVAGLGIGAQVPVFDDGGRIGSQGRRIGILQGDGIELETIVAAEEVDVEVAALGVKIDEFEVIIFVPSRFVGDERSQGVGRIFVVVEGPKVLSHFGSRDIEPERGRRRVGHQGRAHANDRG